MSHPQDARNRPGRYQRSFAGMIGAMLLLVLVIAGFVLFRDANRTDPASPVEPVEWRSAASYARDEASFEVLAPRRLPQGWIATSVRYERGEQETWHLGVLTDEKRYIGLEQSTEPEQTMVERFVDEEAEDGGETDAAGETWQVWRDDTDTALVRESGGVTTLVVSSLGQTALEEYVEQLGLTG